MCFCPQGSLKAFIFYSGSHGKYFNFNSFQIFTLFSQEMVSICHLQIFKKLKSRICEYCWISRCQPSRSFKTIFQNSESKISPSTKVVSPRF